MPLKTETSEALSNLGARITQLDTAGELLVAAQTQAATANGNLAARQGDCDTAKANFCASLRALATAVEAEEGVTSLPITITTP